MTNYATGHQAEVLAAKYLTKKGFTIHQLNWKTKYCEIDIVAQKEGRLYFVEVKYRRKTIWGAAFDYVTPKKVKKMQFAAELWVKAHGWQAGYQLAAVGIDDQKIRFVAVNA